MDSIDAQLLNRLQDGLDLRDEPLARLAGSLGLSAEQALRRIRVLAAPAGVVRQISGIFQAAGFGYDQALVALRLPPDRLDAAGQRAAEHPGVSHCYGRSNEWNLWFTLAVSDHSRLGLEGTVERLAHRSGAHDSMILPAQKRYKLRVRFGPGAAGKSPAAAPPARTPSPAQWTEDHRRAVTVLQLPMPLQTRPFDELARRADLPPDRLLQLGRDLLETGHMRRYAAVLRHRRAGAGANLLAAWQPGPRGADPAGRALSEHPAVSHCYLRPPGPDWPWTLYTMIHGRDESACRQVVADLAETACLSAPVLLWTRREYKKRRLLLLTDDEARWEAQSD
jgi:DNA-binding Lrp family transcriptional regulator